MFNKKSGHGFAHPVFLLIFIAVFAVVGYAGYRVFQSNSSGSSSHSKLAGGSYDKEASQMLTNGHCSGSGSVKIGPFMPLDQISFILPYGLVIGGHVTPIDHQYYNGLLGNKALRDTYDVIAPADGILTSIGHRGSRINTPANTVDVPSSDEYRLQIVHTCSFITTLDLQTSLSDGIKKQLPANWDPNKGWNGEIKVKKGEVLGKIGGQTLDVFVWDLSKKLKGFISYDAYNSDSWKPFTAPVSEYYDSSIKDKVIAKYVRTADPIDGKIDYDVDGKLVGNWFQVGTNGYMGSSRPGEVQNYWKGHLSVAPDFIDPSQFNFSIGNYGSYKGTSSTNQDSASKDNSGAEQFMAKEGSPDPATIGQSNGMVKYELVDKSYVLPNGQAWDNSSFASGIKARGLGKVKATVLVQLVGQRLLKLEAFPGKTAGQVSGFDSNAVMYDRGQDAKPAPSTAT
jgi:hypothetical protein